MKKILGVLLGLFLIAGGLIFALNTLGITNINISFDGWWTLFLIVPSLAGLFKSKDKTGNLIVLAIGIYLLLASRKIIEYEIFWELLVPAVIVLLGIKIVVKSIKGDRRTETEYHKKDTEYMSAFDSKTVDYSGEDFSVAKIGAVFGGTKCNLSDANFGLKANIDVFCMFGGIEIIVPDNVDVKVNAFSLFGGISDKRNIKGTAEKTTELVVNGFCLFGGVDIK